MVIVSRPTFFENLWGMNRIFEGMNCMTVQSIHMVYVDDIPFSDPYDPLIGQKQFFQPYHGHTDTKLGAVRFSFRTSNCLSNNENSSASATGLTRYWTASTRNASTACLSEAVRNMPLLSFPISRRALTASLYLNNKRAKKQSLNLHAESLILHKFYSTCVILW